MTAMNPSASVRVAIIGGGYAGVAAAIELSRYGKKFSATLFDSRKVHQKITQWHKLARGETPARYETPFSELANRFHFSFVQKHIDISVLLGNSVSALGEKFDAIILAQGSHAPLTPPGVVTLDALRDDIRLQEQVRTITRKKIAVIGGGPTGVQFAFEFAARDNDVEIYEAKERLLPTFDLSLGATALRAAAYANVTVRLGTEFLHIENGMLMSRNSKLNSERCADLVLFVPGVKSTPAFTCDVFGRIEGQTNLRLFAAGDNSYFSGRGLNTKSAQAAIRKAQHVVRTLVADVAGNTPKAYSYPELGYFVSLGPKNAVGYLLWQKTAFSGAVAMLMKEAVERQYNLYLEGFNVYP